MVEGVQGVQRVQEFKDFKGLLFTVYRLGVVCFTQITRIAQIFLTTNRTNLSNFCIPKTSKKTKINKNRENPALQKNLRWLGMRIAHTIGHDQDYHLESALSR